MIDLVNRIGERRAMKALIFGASYGSLLGTKLLAAGHDATLVCTPGTAELINAEGTVVRLPVRAREELVELRSGALRGTLDAQAPDGLEPAGYDLVVLAMQEPQYSSDGVRELLERVARARVPAMAIMNMPPPPYLARLPGVDAAALAHCYAEPALWDAFEPGRVTLASPDPQAFRPPGEGKNVLQVSLPTNFKVAPFEDAEPTERLARLERDVRAVEHPLPDGTSVALPVHVRLFDSLYVPLAKWAMLVTGNYRCIGAEGPRSIREAVHDDLERSREIYAWVCSLCESLGAAPEDMVPFEKYARAAEGLAKPSSAARALFGGAPAIERVDALVQGIAAQRGLEHAALDEIVERVDACLGANRRMAAEAD